MFDMFPTRMFPDSMFAPRMFPKTGVDLDIVAGPYYLDAIQLLTARAIAVQTFTPGVVEAQIGET